MKQFWLTGICLAGLFAVSCQEIEQPTTVLTQEQWKEVQQYIITEEPKPQHAVGGKFDDTIELIGLDVTELQAGKKATFTWYWRVLGDVKDNWKVFVHFDSSGKPFRQNLDHVPVNGMYQTKNWKKGQIIKDVQDVVIQRDFPAGKAVTYVGFYKGAQRMKVSNNVSKTQEAQPRLIGPTLEVKAPQGGAVAQPKPRYSTRIIPNEKAGTMVIDGKLEEQVWATIPILRLQPLGNAPKAGTFAKVFVTEDSLYLGAELADTHIWGTLENRDDSTWTQEVLELFLDVNGDGKDYMELQVTPNGTIFDANFKERLGRGKGSREDQITAAKAWNVEGLDSKVQVLGTVNNDSDQDTKWTVELKIPLRSIPGLGDGPKANDTWAVNLYRFDRPKPNQTFAYAWSTGPRGDFHQVEKFGEFRFVTDLPSRPQVTQDMVREIQKNIDARIKPNAGIKTTIQNPATESNK